MRRHTSSRMFRRVAATALVSLWLLPTSAEPGAPAYYAAPVPHAYHVEAPPFAGPANYGHVRPFRWGWFGAEYFCPPSRAHRDYNDNVMGWSRWRLY